MSSLEINVMSNREHVLNRPDTYLGNSVCGLYQVNVLNENGKIVNSVVNYNPAFEKTIIEIGSNCVDNVWRSAQFKVKCTSIKFEYFQDGTMSFWNDGLTIPVVHSKIKGMENLYTPSIVFSVLMSSSNYNDSELRRSSGRNGLGSKIVNVMSKYFKVETQDEKNELHFTQTWYDNMSRFDEPCIVKKKGKGYTKITWMPDYIRFGMPNKLTEGVLGMIKRYLYDIAMVAKIPVFCNGVQLPVKNLVDYSKNFEGCENGDYIYIKTDNSDVVLISSDANICVAFTNGIPNSEGGVHVDAWNKAIFNELITKLNTDTLKITLNEIKKFFSIFVSCSLDNPRFDNQAKSKLTEPKPEASITSAQLNKILKWDVISNIKNLMKSKLLISQKKKLEGGARRSNPKVKKLEDANYAGTKLSHECYLIYCEGDSAKTFAVAGIERGIGEGNSLKQGRDYFGILPCGGKILNVRKADATKIGDNEGIQMLIRSLGLEIGLDYTLDLNFKRLRYGKLMIITDADDDGIHIEGLCHNFFYTLFPSILKRKESFIISMKTPLVRVTLKDGTEMKFYRQQAFKDFQETSSHLIKNRPRHFKGLGTSDDRAVIDCFGQRLIHYSQDENVEDKMKKAFDRDQTTARKEWVVSYDQKNYIESEEKGVDVASTSSHFIENELVVYSVANCARSLPHIMDGMKESQRKIIYTILKQNLTYDKPSKKVYRLSGEVGSMTEYVHGEQNLWNTITGLAWDFVGSNNIPLLVPDGQFGSRLAMGQDASNARYINTRQQEIIPYIFRPEDIPILDYIQGEDSTIEPVYYVPIVPLILINGVRGGIGTGFSSRIPAFNPIDIVKCIKIWINENLDSFNKNDVFSISEFPQIDPWYQGFTGEIKFENGSYTSYGVIKQVENGVVEITELPIGLSVDKFREKLMALRDENKIQDYKDYCSKTRVHFVVYENEKCTINSLKLTSSLPITNMVAFNSDGKINHYKSTDEMIYEFCQTRLKWYDKRKHHIIETYKKQLVISTAKRRFVEEIITDQLKVFRCKKSDIIVSLEERKYPLHEEKYDYLLKMPVDSFTEDLIHKLDGIIDKLNADIVMAETTTTRQMWLKELSEFEDAYARYVSRWQDNENILNCAKNRKEKNDKVVKRRVKK